MESSIDRNRMFLKECIRNIIEDWDCLVKFPHGNEHCILPEVYGDLAEDLTQFFITKKNETTD